MYVLVLAEIKNSHIQLLRERLSFESVIAYATRPNDFKGNSRLPLRDRSSCFNAMKGESMSTVCSWILLHSG